MTYEANSCKLLQVCNLVEDELNNDVNSILATLQLKGNIDDFCYIDYTIIKSPSVINSALFVDGKGITHTHTHIHTYTHTHIHTYTHTHIHTYTHTHIHTYTLGADRIGIFETGPDRTGSGLPIRLIGSDRTGPDTGSGHRFFLKIL